MGVARSAIENLRKCDAELRARHDQLLAARNTLAAGLASPAECTDAARTLVQSIRRAWPDRHGLDCVRALSGGMARESGESGHEGVWARRPGRMPDHVSDVLSGGILTLEQCCVLLP